MCPGNTPHLLHSVCRFFSISEVDNWIEQHRITRVNPPESHFQMRSLSPVSETCVDGVNENPITTCAVWAPEYQKFMATMRRLTTGCNTGPPMSQWDQLCAKCQEVVKEQGYESELKHGPSFHAQLVQLQAEKKLKQLEDKLHEREESERALQEQMIFLSTWDPIVMSPGHTDIVLQSGGHVINAHRAVLVNILLPLIPREPLIRSPCPFTRRMCKFMSSVSFPIC